MNLSAAFIGSLITVFYIDTILKHRRQIEWEEVRARTNFRLSKLGHSGITSVRLALQFDAQDVYDRRISESGDVAGVHSQSIRIADSMLPDNIQRLYDLDEKGWSNLAANLRSLCLSCDQFLMLFGRDLEPDITRLVLDIQMIAEGAMSAYSILPDLMGVPDDRLPRKRDGSSSKPIRDAWTELTTVKLVRLCTLSADLLRKLPPTYVPE